MVRMRLKPAGDSRRVRGGGQLFHERIMKLLLEARKYAVAKERSVGTTAARAYW